MSRPEPKWLKAAKKEKPRCGRCGWRLPEHAPSCPTRWGSLTSAEQIADSRAALMVWAEMNERLREWGVDVSAITAACASGLSGRARELGLESDLPGDYDHVF